METYEIAQIRLEIIQMVYLSNKNEYKSVDELLELATKLVDFVIK